MPRKKYTPQELELLLFEFNLGAPLSELEVELNRPALGIVEKMEALSKIYPDTWSPKRVADYRKEQQRQWYQQHKDEIREQHRQYREQHKDEIREQHRQYREQHRCKWKKFGDYLAGLLDNFNGSKKEVATELGIHPSLLSHYLAGNRKPNEEFLRKVSERFDIPYQTLSSLVR